MKKIASVLLGLGLTIGTAAVFAQEAPAKTEKKKTENKAQKNAEKPKEVQKAKSNAKDVTKKGQKGKTEEPKQQ